MNLKQAVDRTCPKSNIYVLAVVDGSTEEVFYSFNGNPELLLSLLPTLELHIKNKATQ